MCVIAYKHENVKFMSEKNLEDMWKKNPDGAGIMWRDRDTNEICFVKGFMKLKPFKAWVEEHREMLDSVECAVHFRITTHGGTCPGNCHPFVLGGNPHVLEGRAKSVLMHNGILPLTPRSKDISDSAELALRLGGCAKPHETMATLNECLEGNRIIVMDETGTHFYGDPFKKSKEKGCEDYLYSNLYWEPYGYASFGFSPRSRTTVATQCQGQYFDEKSGVFRESFSGKALKLEDVDPDFLSNEDYDIWCEMYEDSYEIGEKARDLGVSASEYMDLEVEAETYGMTVEDYLHMLNEDDEFQERYCYGS